MNTSTIVEFGKKYLKGKVALKAGKALLNKRTGMIGLGVGAAAGVGYLAYTLINKNKESIKNTFKKGKSDITHIDDIDDNHPEVSGEKKIVV